MLIYCIFYLCSLFLALLLSLIFCLGSWFLAFLLSLIFCLGSRLLALLMSLIFCLRSFLFPHHIINDFRREKPDVHRFFIFNRLLLV